MSDRERQRIRAAGTRITPCDEALAQAGRFWCDALTADKRCAVYELRPMICRLWGATESLPCIYGCVPEGGRRLPDTEAYRLIAEAMRIGGGRREHAIGAAGIDTALARPGALAVTERARAENVALERQRAQDAVPAAFRRKSPAPGSR